MAGSVNESGSLPGHDGRAPVGRIGLSGSGPPVDRRQGSILASANAALGQPIVWHRPVSVKISQLPVAATGAPAASWLQTRSQAMGSVVQIDLGLPST